MVPAIEWYVVGNSKGGQYVVVVEGVAMIELSTNRYLKFLWLRKAKPSKASANEP
jgi:hypothetical protein